MKKYLAILVLGLLWCNTAFAEKITYQCFFPSGSPFPDQFNIDTIKKKVDHYDFNKKSMKRYKVIEGNADKEYH